MKLYLAGPMTGLPKYNYPRFEQVTATLRALGYEVITPTELDAQLLVARGFRPLDHEALTFGDYLRNDFRYLPDADAVAVLEGWEGSRGAQQEVAVARLIGMPVLWAGALAAGVSPHSDAARVLEEPETVTQEAQRLVHGPRNQDYGHPADNDERVAALLRAQFGWDVKRTDIWQLMVLTKLARERQRPKRDNRVDVAGYAEVGDWIWRDGRAE